MIQAVQLFKQIKSNKATSKRECEGERTWVKIYPVDARSGSRIEQAASIDVIPAAVPSIVFSSDQKECHICQQISPIRQNK